jgi:low affinity Fe/Cu permease
MVFLIQATQTGEPKAIHLKLDERLRAIAKARTGLVGLEHMSEDELNQLEREFNTIRTRQARRRKGCEPLAEKA